MLDQNILQWKLFREKSHSVKLKGYSAIHFFNHGESAYLMKNGDLHACSYLTPRYTVVGVNQPQPSNTSNNTINLLNLSHFDTFGRCSYNGVKAIFTGSAHTALLDASGFVYCWGSNKDGQLGLGHSSEVPNQWKKWKTSLEKIDQIACGDTFTIALSKFNEVWFWGKLSLDGSNLLFHKTPTLIEFNGDPIVKYISAGNHHFAVFTEDSKVYMMGNNVHGQLALGHRNLLKQPELVPLEFEITHVQCAFEKTIFLSKINELYISDHTTNNTVKCISDTRKIVSLATHWRTSLFVAVDENCFYYKSTVSDDKTTLIRTMYHDISDGFIDVGTPSVYWSRNGMIGLTKTSNGVTSITEKIMTPNLYHLIDVSELYNSQIHSDIAIKLSDSVINAHKLILSKKSRSLQKILNEMDKREKFIDMSKMNANVYKAFINYLYCGKVKLDSLIDLPELYVMAEMDGNVVLQVKCEALWSDSLTKYNIVRAYEKAFLLSLNELLKRCCLVVKLNLQYILNSEEYKSLEIPVKVGLLTSAATESPHYYDDILPPTPPYENIVNVQSTIIDQPSTTNNNQQSPPTTPIPGPSSPVPKKKKPNQNN